MGILEAPRADSCAFWQYTHEENGKDSRGQVLRDGQAARLGSKKSLGMPLHDFVRAADRTS